MKRWTLWLAVGLLVAAAPALKATEVLGGGYGGYYVGAVFPGLQDLNDHLKPQGLDLNPPMFCQGGGGFGYGGAILMGGFGYGGSLTAEHGGRRVELAGGGGAFEMGRIWAVGPVRLALTGLLGGYGYTLSLKPDLPDADFDSLLVHPERMTRLSTGGVMVGVGTLVFVPLTSFLALGLHATLAYVPFGEWQLEDGAEVHGAPNLSRWHPSLQVTVLFGGEGRKRAQDNGS